MPSAELPELLSHVMSHAAATAIVEGDRAFSYDDLLHAAERVAHAVSAVATNASARGERVCILVTPSFGYVAALFGSFRAGAIAVPLCVTHPAAELAHVLDDARPLCVLV